MSEITIRRAELEDTDWILGQLREFSKFLETRHELYGDEKYSRDGIKLLIQEHVFLIAEKNSTPVGFVSGYFTPHLFNPAINILCELFWYCCPDFRGSSVGARLMNAYVEEGKKRAQWITFSLNRHTQVKDSSILKKGFHLHEKTFLLEV